MQEFSPLSRRSFMSATSLTAALSLTGLARAAQGEAGELKPMKLPPPIGRAERVQRIARAQRLMQRSGIAAVLVESGPSLDYFTGIQPQGLRPRDPPRAWPNRESSRACHRVWLSADCVENSSGAERCSRSGSRASEGPSRHPVIAGAGGGISLAILRRSSAAAARGVW